jgi:hypothetical protein
MASRRTQPPWSRWLNDRHGATDDGGRNMLQLSGTALARGILGVFAIALSFGAVQLASGRDLANPLNSLDQTNPAGSSAAAVNRAAKADRAAVMTGLGVLTQTISLRLIDLADTSVLVRVRVVGEGRSNSSAPSATKSGDRKLMVACEPAVSVLTEVFKQLEPGRCVT